MGVRLKYEESHKLIEGKLYKKCNKCGEWLLCTLDYFYKSNGKTKDGLFPYCKNCNKKKALDWQYSNYDHWKEIVSMRDATPQKKEKTRELSRLQRENGYFKEYQKANADKMRYYSTQRHQSKEHNIKEKEWEACKEYFNNSCAYCGISEKDAKVQQNQNLHREHVNHKGANDVSNCVPSCKSCNSKKWEFELEEWYNKENPIFKKERLDKIYKWISEDYKNISNK